MCLLRVACGLLACGCIREGCGRRGAPPVANTVRMLRRRSTDDTGRARGGQVGTLEAIKVKILIMGEEQNPLTLRIELTSENDLFFHFNHNLDEHGFRQVTLKADTARTHACTMDAQPRPQTHRRLWYGWERACVRAGLQFSQDLQQARVPCVCPCVGQGLTARLWAGAVCLAGVGMALL